VAQLAAETLPAQPPKPLQGGARGDVLRSPEVWKGNGKTSDGSMDPGGTSNGVSLKKLRLLDFKIRSYFESKRLP